MRARPFSWLKLLLLANGLGAAIVFWHNYIGSALPDRKFVITPASMLPLEGHAYFTSFAHSQGDTLSNPLSRATLYENGHLLPYKLRLPNGIIETGEGSWMHQPDRIIFSATDNTDPRVNGRTYTLSSPILYHPTAGILSAAVLITCLLAYLYRRPASPILSSPGVPFDSSRYALHIVIASLVFAAGLYFSSGTLSPYANTNIVTARMSTGYLHNLDLREYLKLFAFVDGRDRSQWGDALLLRRILFPLASWPFMKTWGFEIGGFIASLAFNLTGFAIAVRFIRRTSGANGAILGAWLMALYPGAAYWGGLPYPYALIFPGSLLLAIALHRLSSASPLALSLWSLGMGAVYLGYDLQVFFLPASFLLLVADRRPLAAIGSATLQLIPLVAWSAWLSYGLHISWQNSNTASYGTIIGAYFHIPDLLAWLRQVPTAFHAGFAVFFSANFIVLPLLFLLAVITNRCWRLTEFTRAELMLLLSVAGVFLFNNLAPDYIGSWNLKGSWIARLYQPVFPVFIFFLARWWEALCAINNRPWRTTTLGIFAIGLAANSFIIFGPILNNPLHLSEAAFYRFYDHTDRHWIYEQNLQQFGRRPLGFPRQLEAP